MITDWTPQILVRGAKRGNGARAISSLDELTNINYIELVDHPRYSGGLIIVLKKHKKSSREYLLTELGYKDLKEQTHSESRTKRLISKIDLALDTYFKQSQNH